jgi:hypothetical protein
LPAVPPNVTASVVPVKLDPVMVTAVPPAVGPCVGAMAVMVGTGGMNLKPVAFVIEPPESETVTATLPAVWAGVVTLIVEEFGTVKVDAAVEPNVTAIVVAVKFEPVMVTFVPPAVGPCVGVTEVIDGAGGMNLKPVAFVIEPPESVTLTRTLPAVWAGVVTFTAFVRAV